MVCDLISIVIPAYNAEKTIARTLDAALAQSYKGAYEVIVVDDGSNDGTRIIVEKYKNVRYLFQENAGPAAARNKGFEASKGEIVFFTDSDCAPHVRWVERALKFFDAPDIAAVAGSYKLGNPGSILASCIHGEIIFRHVHLMPIFPKSFGSYNFCVRRNVFAELGGFNTDYREASGEDNDLSYRIIQKGYKIRFALEVLVTHWHTEMLKKYLYEQYRHGFWRARMYLDHPKMSRGDDYTFWKDIIEPPIVIGFFVLLIGGSAFPLGLFSDPACPFFIAIGLLLLQVVFGLRICRDGFKGTYFGGVMFFRAFYRTFGFLAGAASYLFNLFAIPSKKNK